MQTDYNVYYRTLDNDKKVLHRIFAENMEDHIDALQTVMHDLHKNMDVFLNPVLVVVNGSKTSVSGGKK